MHANQKTDIASIVHHTYRTKTDNKTRKTENWLSSPNTPNYCKGQKQSRDVNTPRSLYVYLHYSRVASKQKQAE